MDLDSSARFDDGTDFEYGAWILVRIYFLLPLRIGGVFAKFCPRRYKSYLDPSEIFISNNFLLETFITDEDKTPEAEVIRDSVRRGQAKSR